MHMPNNKVFAFPKTPGLVIDLFAGGGGASLGFEMATGQSPHYALNHNEVALAMHKRNHPNTTHICQNIKDANPLEITKGRPVSVLIAAPDCSQFSGASVGIPKDRRVRELAWSVIRWVKLCRPQLTLVENVSQFEKWCPLDENMRPIKEQEGETFQEWLQAFRELGYNVEFEKLKCCDYGAPTIRERLFIVARNDNNPIVWPKPTHADRYAEGFQDLGLLPWITTAEIIDWSIISPSIFLTEREAKIWEQLTGKRIQRPLKPATHDRIRQGIDKFVLGEHAWPFIVQTNHQSKTFRGQSLLRPINTITAARDATGLVTPVLDGNDRTTLVKNFIALHNTGAIGMSFDKPLPTVTTRGTQINLVSTLLGKPTKQQAAFITKFYSTSKHGQSMREPLATVTASGQHLGLVLVDGVERPIEDVLMRMLSPRELFRASGFPDSFVIDEDCDGNPINSTDQIEKCGNAIPPQVVEAQLSANLQTLEMPIAA